MAKGSSKSAAAIERLLEERRQYEAWLARIKATADSVSDDVRTRVKADYEARLKAVMEELRSHADAARQLVAERKESLRELQKKEKAAAERLAETELRHEVGEYDEAQWAQVHKDALADLGAVRDELMGIERDITRLVELDALVKAKPAPPAPPPSRNVAEELTLTPSPSTVSPEPRGVTSAARRCFCGSAPCGRRGRARWRRACTLPRRHRPSRLRARASARCAGTNVALCCEWRASAPGASLSWRI